MRNIITIPGYKNTLPNSVWEREVKELNHPEIGPTSALHVIVLERYRVPTVEEVIQTIQKNLRKICASPQKENQNFIDQLIKNQPASDLEKILEEKKEVINKIENHFPDQTLKTGKTYLKSISGFLPLTYIKKEKNTLNKIGMIAYERLIHQQGYNEINLKVKIEKNSLPIRTEIEYLLKRGVRESYILSASGDYRNYRDVKRHIRLLYKTFTSKSMIRNLPENSTKALDTMMMSTLKNFLDSIPMQSEMHMETDKLSEFITKENPFKDLPGYDTETIPYN